ncbi:MAG: PhzF family phenazine biosynthesis protein [Micrococcales bacterium]|nr:PhzF family phenazine biosynthesis protein [Micrococcales bacterium]
MSRRFAQVDVFTTSPLRGNPVAVVLDGEGLDDDRRAAFARWTNLSETTFVLPPTQPGADYRVRILTPGGELPFAGHPTLGTCHAWLEAGGQPADPAQIVQECEAGLVTVRREGDSLAFAAPPLIRTGPLEEEVLEAACASLGIGRAEVLDHQWVDNGPGWAALLLADAQAVLALAPDLRLMAAHDLKLGAVGPYAAAAPSTPGSPDPQPDIEVRAFVPSLGVGEDPVTGSLNAGIAQWLIGAGRLPAAYTARQGTALGRDGRVHISSADGQVWVGGGTRTVLSGAADLG